MGSFDVFCALCSSSLCQAEIGSASKRQREVRQRFIAKKIEELKACNNEQESPSVSDKSSEEQWEDATEVQENNSEDGQEVEDDNEDEDRDEEEEEEEEADDDDDDGAHSYDPDILNEESVKWLNVVHVLGYNPGAPGPSKAYISGQGEYVDYVTAGSHTSKVKLTITKLISLLDPNSPQNPNLAGELDNVSCYTHGWNNDIPAFPFHWCCFEILTRVLTGSTDICKINKDILYNVMIGLSPEYERRLAIDYGSILGVEQFWGSVPGEEYAVTHPTIIPGFEEALQQLISEMTLKATSTGRLQLADKVKLDPFSNLPYDILHYILQFLPGDSTRAFMAASWSVYNATRHPALWKRLIYWGMPWFWELHKLVEEHSTDLDYKNLYLWLDKATRPSYGMNGPFLGIANRRRIWGACTQLAERYFSSFHKPDNPDEPADEDFNSVLQELQIMQLPIVKYPQPNSEVRTISKQLLYTLDEFDSRSATLETFWTSGGSLMGLTVIFGTSRRVFGRAMATDGVHKRVIFIDSSNWITGLVLYMSELDLLDSRSSVAVEGIDIIFQFGQQASVGSKSGNHRSFMVSKGHYLIGLVGQTGEDEIISRFGILESPITKSRAFSTHDVKLVPTSDRPFGQQLLWGLGVSELESSSSSYGGRWPIWNHPDFHVLSSRNAGDISDGVPSDLVPYQPFIWALHDHELQKLTQISAYVKKDITKSGLMTCILGLRAAYTRRYWEPKRYVGEFPREDNEDGPQETPDGEICHFDINGPDSEYVVGVEFATGDFLRAIKDHFNVVRFEPVWEERRVLVIRTKTTGKSRARQTAICSLGLRLLFDPLQDTQRSRRKA
ncbi:hypothetical protein AJ78_03901 [Emergomyces pasteurianus Ep9510]|uniref:Uncharacterized protein n=1 Tax=Emergomyces pasteurianus Ep9510 TaxID=1447872 RepID=A0A1J9Q6M5_9EURO|nr:hypothetical protein AJ78_03901 [Emergomyces pasteurianus Ep9510]